MALTVGVNSYLTIEEANDYFADRFGADEWATLEEPVKSQLMIGACLVLDRYCDWLGEKAVETQDLEFPRDDMDVVPNNIKYAQCELSLAIYDNGGLDEEVENNLQRMKVDVIEFQWNQSARTTSSIYTSMVKRLLSPYCGGRKLVRV